jgi:hypothetical protein
MDSVEIVYASLQEMNKDRTDSWRHPITLATGDKGYVPSSASFLVTALASDPS